MKKNRILTRLLVCRRNVWVGAALAPALLFVWMGTAGGETFLEQIKPHPHIRLAARYDDKVFLDATGRRSDFSFSISPGLQLFLGDQDSKLQPGDAVSVPKTLF